MIIHLNLFRISDFVLRIYSDPFGGLCVFARVIPGSVVAARCVKLIPLFAFLPLPR